MLNAPLLGNGAPLLGNGSRHGNCITAVMSRTWWDAIAQLSSKSVHPSAILNWNFDILDHSLSHACGPITVSKFGVDPIFPAEYIAILWFFQFGWKMPNHAPFQGFLGGLSPWNCGSSSKPQKTHPWARTRHLSHKRLKSVQGFDQGANPIKKYNQDTTGQDRTIKKSQKRNISHISGQSYCNKMWHRGRCPQGSYVDKAWSLKFKGCKFYRGLKFGLLH